jgi:alpha/beta superfamily hydrolase
MFNNVVDAIEQGFSAKGFTTLKFNFRGVGKSEGVYDEGKGEVHDLLAALKFLREKIDKNAFILLAGYSFGAWIASKAAMLDKSIDGLFLVAYPFAFYDAHEIKSFSKTIYLIGGMYDDIGPVKSLLEFYKSISIKEKYLKIIPTSHFFNGKEDDIINFITENVIISS